MKPLAECRLYTFVDAAYLNGSSPEEVARELCDGGSDLIQLRAKEFAPDQIRRMAEAILPVTTRAKVGLVINDYPELARDVGAEFAHLGQEDFFDPGRKRVNELDAKGLKIGLSSHSPEQARRAIEAGADYIAVGPVFATATKPAAKPVTVSFVKWAAEHVPVPWFAIGGINLNNVAGVLAAGAKRICVVSAILNASDRAGVCRQFRKYLDR